MVKISQAEFTKILKDRPAHLTPSDIVDALRRRGKQVEGLDSLASGQPPMKQIVDPGQVARGRGLALTGKALDLIPAAGAIGGAAIFAPTAAVSGPGGPLLGAGLGGAGGEAIRQLIARPLGLPSPETPMDALRGIDQEAFMQTLSELTGRGMVKAGGAVGKGAMNLALKPSAELRKQFGDIVESMMRRRIPVGKLAGRPASTRGSAIAEDVWSSEVDDMYKRIAAAESKGVKSDVVDIGKRLIENIERRQGRPLTRTEQSRAYRLVVDHTQDFISRPSHGVVRRSGADLVANKLKPSELKGVKQVAQDEASDAYLARAKGQVSKYTPNLMEDLAKAYEGTLDQAVPGIDAVEANVKEMKGIREALAAAEGKMPGWMAATPYAAFLGTGVASKLAGGQDSGPSNWGGNALGAFLLARGMLTPSMVSRGALAMTHPLTREFSHQFPRGIEALLGGSGTE